MCNATTPTPYVFFFFLMIRRPPRSTLFPTRRSSDLHNGARTIRDCCEGLRRLDYADYEVIVVDDGSTDATAAIVEDRKSTRLNSSHLVISYAVFCLKKKKTTDTPTLHCVH